MYFNNPLILYALLLIIIPVILHFLNLNKVKKIEFSSLMFLKEVKEKKIRKLKIQYLLLMIIRILLIAFMVFTFSNPVINNNFPENVSGNNSVIFVDNSPSSAIGNTETLINLKNTIKNINNLYASTSNVHIHTIDGLVYGNNNGMNFGGTDLSFNPDRNLGSLIKYLMPFEKYKSNDIYILSGFFRSDYKDYPVINNYYKNYNLHLININDKTHSNLAIKSIVFGNPIPDKNSKQKIEVEIHNYNKFDVFNKRVSLFINDGKYYEKLTDIPSGKSVVILFDVPSEKQPFINGYVELFQDKISDDEVVFDNKKYFSINFPKLINLLFVGDSRRSFEFIEKALNTTDEGIKENTLFRINYSNSINTNIKDYSLLILSGKKDLTKEDILSLHSFLSTGKGIIIFPGANMGIESYNSFLNEYESSFKIQNIEVREKVEDKLIISKTNEFLVSGVFEKSVNEKSEYSEAINIKSIMNVFNNNSISQIIENSEKKGVLFKISANKKGILLFSLASDYSMSDFPSKSIYLPLIFRSIFSLSDAFNNFNFIVGNPGIISVNQESFLIPVDTNYAKSGNYEFNNTALSFNIDMQESDMTKADKIEVIDFYKKIGFNDVKYYESSEQFIRDKEIFGHGVNLYYYLLSIVFFILLAEMFYSRKLTQKLKLTKEL